MKTITFQSQQLQPQGLLAGLRQQFSVPSWANYITQDIDGYYVWECEPGFNEGTRTYYNKSPARCCEAFPMPTDVHVIMKIEN